jgi:uncharacterized RDD family membrane protein YckC
MPSQIDPSPDSWKQEVNRRVAAHRSRKGVEVVEPSAPPAHHAASSRAAQAAARVAARYAKAPSYSEALAEEARVAVRAASAAAEKARAASAAAQQAHAAAVNVLAGLEEAAQAVENHWPELPCPAARVTLEGEAVPLPLPMAPAQLSAPVEPEAAPVAPQDYSIRWEPDFEQRHQEQAASAQPEPEPELWQQPAAYEPEPIEVVEPGRPIHANLIEFPREIVATRRVRPRLAEGPTADEAMPGEQLSIFEVDPHSVATAPAAGEPAQAEWAEWSSFKLPAKTEEEEFLLDEADYLADRARRIEAAPVGLRMMATVVNGSLIVGGFLAIGLLALTHAQELPPMRSLVTDSALGLLLSSAVYLQLFYVLGKSTPGMKYAHLRLATLDGEVPTRGQRLMRLFSVAFSILPLGLGLVWFLFDEDHLCWHDRLSRTYLRRY